MGRRVLSGLFFILFCVSVWAQEPAVEDFKINWLEGHLELYITAPLPESNPTPRSRFQTEQRIIKQMPRLFVEALSPVLVDSWNSIGDSIEENPALYRELEQLAESLNKSFSIPSEDMRSLTVTFSMPLFPHLSELFILHEGAGVLTRRMGFEPTADFTGIIILAAGELPVTGSGERASLTPSLFPRVYDVGMTPVVDMRTTDPNYLRKWGTAGYSDSYDLEALQDRVGTYPLRIVAKSVFGRYSTDPVISRQDARRILLSENNRRLLKEGRVVIIY